MSEQYQKQAIIDRASSLIERDLANKEPFIAEAKQLINDFVDEWFEEHERMMGNNGRFDFANALEGRLSELHRSSNNFSVKKLKFLDKLVQRLSLVHGDVVELSDTELDMLELS
jgi:hypothetical protein